MDKADSSRLLARLAALFLLGVCFAFWPLAGYAATLLATGSADGVDAVDQPSLTVIKSANPTSAIAGTTITYTYRITNSGTVTYDTITAVDSELGLVAGLAGSLAPSVTRSAILTYTVLDTDPAGPLVNTVTVTGTYGGQFSTVLTATATVVINDPTALPPAEQPNQPSRRLFLPSVQQTE
jgi:hypothetical protein